MKYLLRTYCFLAGTFATSILCMEIAYAQSHDAHSQPIAGIEPDAQLIVSAPIAALLSKGVVVVPIRVEHVKIMPVYGEAALQVAPRIGHFHVTVDRASWHWVHASNEPIVIQGLSSGQHHLTIDLAQANHHVIASQELDIALP